VTDPPTRTARVAEWLVTRPWLPGNAQHAVNVETLRALAAILESLTRIEAELVVRRTIDDARPALAVERGSTDR
jgi:hypothetical protein